MQEKTEKTVVVVGHYTWAVFPFTFYRRGQWRPPALLCLLNFPGGGRRCNIVTSPASFIAFPHHGHSPLWQAPLFPILCMTYTTHHARKTDWWAKVFCCDRTEHIASFPPCKLFDYFFEALGRRRAGLLFLDRLWALSPTKGLQSSSPLFHAWKILPIYPLPEGILPISPFCLHYLFPLDYYIYMTVVWCSVQCLWDREEEERGRKLWLLLPAQNSVTTTTISFTPPRHLTFSPSPCLHPGLPAHSCLCSISSIPMKT